MQQIMMGVSLIASIFGMGTGVVSQGAMIHQQLRPQQQYVQQCPPQTQPRIVMQNGQQVYVCVDPQTGNVE